MIKTIILQKLGLRIQHRKDSFKGNDLWNNCFSRRRSAKKTYFLYLKAQLNYDSINEILSIFKFQQYIFYLIIIPYYLFPISHLCFLALTYTGSQYDSIWR